MGATAGLPSSASCCRNFQWVPLLACPAVRLVAMIFGMKQPPGHRKQIRHYHDPGHIHELTFSCYLRSPLLTNDVWRAMLAESIDRAMEGHRYRLAAFVFMPEHVHLIIYPLAQADPIDTLLKAIKRPFSYRIKQLLVQSKSPLLQELTVHQRPGVMTFRYWQEGPGYDRNLTKANTVLAAIDYLHLNPVRRRLVQRAIDWQWSSARFYLLDPPQQYYPLPTIHNLPAEWLDTTD
jgi:putative transposase